MTLGTFAGRAYLTVFTWACLAMVVLLLAGCGRSGPPMVWVWPL